MANKETVTVIGLGYVGLPSAALMANAGYEVFGVDTNTALIDTLNEGRCNLGEAKVVEVVTNALKTKQLTVGSKAKEADIFIICVPTPVKEDKTADLTMVTNAIRATAPFVRKGNMVILESTSPINTTRDIIAATLSEQGLDPNKDVDVCYCPERVFPGNTINEILNNDRVVGGLSPRAASRAAKFYESFCNGKPTTTTASAAEFSKLMENTFRDVNIALANTFSHIAEEAGVDVMEVIKMANMHPRVNVHLPGPGVGGHCIPVDPWFLIESYPEVTKLLKLSRDINNGQALHILSQLERAGLPSSSKVAILGAAYRGDIDDARDSPTELLIDALADKGYHWVTHDPYVTKLHMHSKNPANLTSDLGLALRDADAAVIITDHSVYKKVDVNVFKNMRGKIIFDSRALLNSAIFTEKGYSVMRIGAPMVAANN